ncbi:MAG: hypothetical protein J07HN6_00966 [Halonotius sp. J07HN6]|jgi:hypothetical protein|nr:MAG: hypothetical protein J07HN6_00966 [Halonotius sp. J07HN6]ESS09950.1 MAG: hypothetical protein A07HN63_00386 [uncultured archaeon A07HN63]
MATDTATGLSDHMRGITVTTVSCLAGVIAALVSAVVVGTTADAATGTRPLLVLAVAVFAQFPVLKLVGVDVADFGAKDNLYVVFMTFCLWFITYAVLLTSAVSG